MMLTGIYQEVELSLTENLIPVGSPLYDHDLHDGAGRTFSAGCCYAQHRR